MRFSCKGNKLIYDRCYKVYKIWGWSKDEILPAFKRHPHIILQWNKKNRSDSFCNFGMVLYQIFFGTNVQKATDNYSFREFTPSLASWFDLWWMINVIWICLWQQIQKIILIEEMRDEVKVVGREGGLQFLWGKTGKRGYKVPNFILSMSEKTLVGYLPTVHNSAEENSGIKIIRYLPFIPS